MNYFFKVYDILFKEQRSGLTMLNVESWVDEIHQTMLGVAKTTTTARTTKPLGNGRNSETENSRLR